MASPTAEGEYAWWPDVGEAVRVLRRTELWGQGTWEVMVPSSGRSARVPSSSLQPLAARQWSAAEVIWRAAAARVIHLLAAGQLVAPGQGDLVPLPHQLVVLGRALAADPVRLLLADEVGLGKTIEAGLIISELKARGLVRRVVIVAPKGMQFQWIAELADRFGEEFVLVGPGGVPVDVGVNPWQVFDQVVCSIDSVKPLRARTGWPPERLTEYNERRFRALVQAGWDLVVIDEAHHVGGSSDEVARHRLGRELSARCPRVLLLSATPHSGKSDSFARLLGLLDNRFVNGLPLTREHVAPLVARTEKRSAVDADGRPLFRPRVTSLEVVRYGGRRVEEALYEAVTEYVRHGWRRALAERRPAVGFLVLLMQRLVSSSSAAILAALERRLVAVTLEGTQLRLFADRAEEWAELAGEEQFAALADARGQAWGNERAEVEVLLDLARKATAAGVDAKAGFLLDLLARIGREEGAPSVKALVFTEFVPTQEMLLNLLVGAGIAAVAINGSMSIEERRVAQEVFRLQARVLVATDAAGEGINLQFAHVVINYDLPWSPTRIEQRIGRVDRIGQTHDVRAFNLVLENSVDARVIEVLEEKLAVILSELGVDKAGDVLAGAARSMDDLYTTAILDPALLAARAAELEARTRADVAAVEPLRAAMAGAEASPVPKPSGDVDRWLRLSIEARERLGRPTPDRMFAVLDELPEVAPGEPVPLVTGQTAGWWSLWEVRPEGEGRARDCFALFTTDTGSVRPDLAERLWAALAAVEHVQGSPPPAGETLERLWRAGADHGWRAASVLAAGRALCAPWLALRLMVRVEEPG
jgi:superfamily II DNA or RNA helicase